jgi:hypothetical protein
MQSKIRKERSEKIEMTIERNKSKEKKKDTNQKKKDRNKSR